MFDRIFGRREQEAEPASLVREAAGHKEHTARKLYEIAAQTGDVEKVRQAREKEEVARALKALALEYEALGGDDER